MSPEFLTTACQVRGEIAAGRDLLWPETGGQDLNAQLDAFNLMEGKEIGSEHMMRYRM